jgi:hypothetical protein
MALDPAQEATIQDWFNKKCPKHACPACASRTWTIGNLVGLPEAAATGTGAQVGVSSLIPSVLRVCNGCGYIAHFSLQAILTARP